MHFCAKRASLIWRISLLPVQKGMVWSLGHVFLHFNAHTQCTEEGGHSDREPKGCLIAVAVGDTTDSEAACRQHLAAVSRRRLSRPRGSGCGLC